MKSKELRREEAEARAKVSTFVSPETVCKDCKSYKKAWCSTHGIYVPRKSTCENYKRR